MTKRPFPSSLPKSSIPDDITAVMAFVCFGSATPLRDDDWKGHEAYLHEIGRAFTCLCEAHGANHVFLWPMGARVGADELKESESCMKWLRDKGYIPPESPHTECWRDVYEMGSITEAFLIETHGRAFERVLFVDKVRRTSTLLWLTKWADAYAIEPLPDFSKEVVGIERFDIHPASTLEVQQDICLQLTEHGARKVRDQIRAKLVEDGIAPPLCEENEAFTGF